jgi:hypothetical protein
MNRLDSNRKTTSSNVTLKSDNETKNNLIHSSHLASRAVALNNSSLQHDTQPKLSSSIKPYSQKANRAEEIRKRDDKLRFNDKEKMENLKKKHKQNDYLIEAAQEPPEQQRKQQNQQLNSSLIGEHSESMPIFSKSLANKIASAKANGYGELSKNGQNKNKAKFDIKKTTSITNVNKKESTNILKSALN